MIKGLTLATVSVAALGLGFSGSAYAQVAGNSVSEQPAADSGDNAASTKEAEIVVTGSYLSSGPKSQRGTLDVVNADDIAKSNRASLGEMLAQLPSTQGNLITGASNDQGNNPAGAINLRGLGPRATLVLLNGQRQVPISEAGGVDSFSVDVNTLVPSALIGRVEVLKDGASALYGSDAVAGVVNFITRRDLDGVVVDSNLGILEAKGRKNGRVSFGFGSQGDRTSIIIGGEYSHQDQVLVTDVYDQARIAKYGQTSAFSNPTTFFPNGVATPDPLCASTTIGGSPIAGLLVAGRCRQDLTAERGMIAGIDRGTGYANIKHELTDHLSINAELGASTVSLKRFNNAGFPANTTTFTAPASNPGNPFGVATTFNYRIGSLYLGDKSVTHTSSDTYRAKVSLDGDIAADWKFSVGAYYGLNRSNSRSTGYASASRLQAALNCRGGTAGNLCFNPFASSYLATAGSRLANSAEVLNYISAVQQNASRYSLTTYDARVTGSLFDMPNGLPVKVAIGLQRRQERTSAIKDDATRTGDISFGGANGNYSVARDVNAAFIELLVPVLTNLEVSAAGRYEESKPGSSSFNPKIGLSYRIVPDLSLTGSIGRSERAPGLLQYIQSGGLVNIARDPITGNAQNGVAILQLASTNLDPETSVNWNVGADYSPKTSFGSIHLGVDYFNINFKHLITSTDVAALVISDPLNPAIRRDPLTGQIILVTVPGFFNSNSLNLAGVDFNARINFNALGGSLFVSTDGTLTTKYDFTSGGVKADLLGRYNTNVSNSNIAKLIGRVSAGYDGPKLGASVTANYKSKLRESQIALIGLTEEKSYTTFDLSAQYHVTEDISFSAGVTNLFDKLAPAQGNSIYTVNGIAYPVTGRSYNLGAHVKF